MCSYVCVHEPVCVYFLSVGVLKLQQDCVGWLLQAPLISWAISVQCILPQADLNLHP